MIRPPFPGERKTHSPRQDTPDGPGRSCGGAEAQCSNFPSPALLFGGQRAERRTLRKKPLCTPSQMENFVGARVEEFVTRRALRETAQTSGSGQCRQ